jgi:hypothetical protein
MKTPKHGPIGPIHKQKHSPRTSLSPTGSFVSIPEAFKDVDEGLKHVVKLEFRTAFSEKSTQLLNLETIVSTDRVLFDLGAVLPSALDSKKMARDCELLREAFLNHPEKIRQLVEAFYSNGPQPDSSQALKIAEELGLTEELAIQNGGGFLPLIILGCILLAGGCFAHCGPYIKK